MFGAFMLQNQEESGDKTKSWKRSLEVGILERRATGSDLVYREINGRGETGF